MGQTRTSSELGLFIPQQRTCGRCGCMSVWCQFQTHAPQQTATLFDHLVSVAEVAGAREAERLGGLEWDSLVGKAARSRESVMLTVSILRRRQCAAAVDTPSDGGHAGLAHSAFEAVSATNSFQ
jgi:hypothetical protein